MTPLTRQRPGLATVPLGSELRSRGAEVVAEVGRRLADPARVAEIAGRDDNRDPIYDVIMWAPLTLSNGWPGVAVCLAELDGAHRPPVHPHLAMAGELVPGSPHRGLFAGPASVLAAAQSAAGGRHYRRLRATLAEWLARMVLAQLEREAVKPGVSWASYDLINGLSGSLRLLLDSAADPDEDGEHVRQALELGLRRLVEITEPITVQGRRVPGWWVSSDAQVSERDRGEYPEGDFNLGLAHGIPGPLAVLSHAIRLGHEVPGQREAIARIADWLLGWRLTDEAGAYWPCRVAFAEETATRRMRYTSFTRTAWCYGAPGVAVGLHAAGRALRSTEWTEAATGALRDALARTEGAWNIDGPTVCHGYAGLLTVCASIGRDTGDSVLLRGAARLTECTVNMADEARPFLYAHLMQYPRAKAKPGHTHRALDVAGLLEGAAGVAAALQDVLREDSAAPSWHRFLGLR